ncbi:MAG: hypothetical protein MJ214_03550 [Bacilli bacterium]|nr:hypothetical protein [Bacilli bacterium]
MKVKKIKKELRSMVEFKEFLKNPSPKVKVPLYTEIEVIQTTTNSGDDTVKKPTLSQKFDTLSQRLDELTELVKDGFKRVDTRIDNLEKDVNARIDRIDARLDYNGLKKLPNNK